MFWILMIFVQIIGKNWTIVYMLNPTHDMPKDNIYPVISEWFDQYDSKVRDYLSFKENPNEFRLYDQFFFLVNTEKELKQLLGNSAKLPEIDFSSHTLIIGMADVEYGSSLDYQRIHIEDSMPTLQLYFKKKMFLNQKPTDTREAFFIWGVYPKLPYETIKLKSFWDNSEYSGRVCFCQKNIYSPNTEGELKWEVAVPIDSLGKEVETDDYKYTRQLSRFDDYTPSQAYWEGYRDGRWTSPWYYGRYGWYSTWYDPWYISWYDPWYDPWYYGGYYGWNSSWRYGWYGSYYRPWGYYYSWYTPIYYYGGRGHKSTAHDRFHANRNVSGSSSFGNGFGRARGGSSNSRGGFGNSRSSSNRSTTTQRSTFGNSRSNNSGFGSRSSSSSSSSFGSNRSSSSSSSGGSRGGSFGGGSRSGGGGGRFGR